uniref:Domain of unknown function DB domain-containing protein n=1 Tax=Meloidogyne javanica TaxID=6303 RepID=A0A915MJA5_MELJA
MAEEGCWHDHETNGIQCLCQKDFCNSPRNLWTSDPTKPPIDGLKMLKRNPFVDYEYLEEESSSGKKSSSSSSSESINSIISSLDASENEDERDLVPINFDDYLNCLGGCSFLSGYPGYQRCLTANGATYYRNCYGGICRHHHSLKGSQTLSLNESGSSENNRTNGDENGGEEKKDDFGAIQLRSMFLNSNDCPIESASIIHFCASQNQDHRECCLRSGIEQTRAGPKCLLFCDQVEGKI